MTSSSTLKGILWRWWAVFLVFNLLGSCIGEFENSNCVHKKSGDEESAFCTAPGDLDSEDIQSEHDEEKTRRMLQDSRMVIDSIDVLWDKVDKDSNGYLTEEEIIANIKENLDRETKEEEINSTAKMILDILDSNLDTGVTIYELRFTLDSIMNSNMGMYSGEAFDYYEPEFLKWITEFVGRSPRKVYFHVVKLYQLFDEDINGKLYWKEVRMVAKMIEKFNKVLKPNAKTMAEEAIEKVFKDMDEDDNKWLDLIEFLDLLRHLGVNILDNHYPMEIFEWIIKFLEGNSEHSMASETTHQEFERYDSNSDGIISKGELIESLQNHRKDFYTDARINRRFSRSDRNADGKISFNEYHFLHELRNRK